MPRRGFSSEDATQFQTAFRTRYPALFSQLARIEDHARFLLGQFRLDKEDVQGILIAGYFSRAIDNAHASVVVAERGRAFDSLRFERALVVSDDGRVLALTGGPNMAEAAGVFVGGIEILLNVSMAAAAYLDMDFMDYWQSEHDTLRQIAEAMLAGA